MCLYLSQSMLIIARFLQNLPSGVETAGLYVINKAQTTSDSSRWKMMGELTRTGDSTIGRTAFSTDSTLANHEWWISSHTYSVVAFFFSDLQHKMPGVAHSLDISMATSVRFLKGSTGFSNSQLRSQYVGFDVGFPWTLHGLPNPSG